MGQIIVDETSTAVEGRPDGDTPITIDLKDPLVCGLLAWLVPGLGHGYQGRWHKAVLFFVCIFGTFVYGLYLGEGRVVYASWKPEDRRPPFFCQAGVGLAALPALVQARRSEPFEFPFFDRFMVPPKTEPDAQLGRSSEHDRLQKRLHRFWELGTVYTMIAGLLNILAIYDACCGPVIAQGGAPRGKRDEVVARQAGPPTRVKPPEAPIARSATR